MKTTIIIIAFAILVFLVFLVLISASEENRTDGTINPTPSSDDRSGNDYSSSDSYEACDSCDDCGPCCMGMGH